MGCPRIGEPYFTNFGKGQHYQRWEFDFGFYVFE
jgi:hypothetical protein